MTYVHCASDLMTPPCDNQISIISFTHQSLGLTDRNRVEKDNIIVNKNGIIKNNISVVTYKPIYHVGKTFNQKNLNYTYYL